MSLNPFSGSAARQVGRAAPCPGCRGGPGGEESAGDISLPAHPAPSGASAEAGGAENGAVLTGHPGPGCPRPPGAPARSPLEGERSCSRPCAGPPSCSAKRRWAKAEWRGRTPWAKALAAAGFFLGPAKRGKRWCRGLVS